MIFEQSLKSLSIFFFLQPSFYMLTSVLFYLQIIMILTIKITLKLFIIMDQSKNTNGLSVILGKQYESRTPAEHHTLYSHFQQLFPQFQKNKIKWISLFAQIVIGQQLFSQKNEQISTIVITNYSLNSQKSNPVIRQIEQNTKIVVPQGQYAILIQKKSLVKCESLGKISIEDEISFFHSSEYFQQMPRKKYFQLLRNCSILSYSFDQTPYVEGQLIKSQKSQKSGVYLVRLGSFSYLKKDSMGKDVEVYSFHEGHLFGSQEMLEANPQEEKQEKRMFTIQCKSSQSIVYKFSQQFFYSMIKVYSQKALLQNLNNIQSYMSKTISKVIDNRTTYKFYLTQTKFEPKPQILTFFTSKSKKNSLQSFPSINLSQKSKSKSKKQQQSRISLGKKLSLNKNTAQPQQNDYNDIEKLLEKKQKCNSLRRLAKPYEVVTRGEVLFRLFKHSWQFQKQKHQRVQNKKF